MTDFTMTTDADGIAVITWDCAEKSMNVLNWDALRALDGFIDTVIADEAIKGAIITSGKKDFAAGMDLNVLADLRNASGDNPAQGMFDGVMQMPRSLQTNQCPKSPCLCRAEFFASRARDLSA